MKPEPHVYYIKIDDAFVALSQNKFTNTVTKINATRKEQQKMIAENRRNDLILERGEITLTLAQIENNKMPLRTGVWRALDFITLVVNNSPKTRFYRFNVADYMELYNLKNARQARQELRENMKTLGEISIDIKSYRGTGFTHIIDSFYIKRGGVCIFALGSLLELVPNFLTGKPMKCPRKLFELNDHNNPNSYYLLRKLSEHKHMNKGKTNENMISIKALLDNTPLLSEYDEIMEGDRHVSRLIIEPFIRDMNAFNDVVNWEFAINKEYDDLTYDEFIIDSIVFDWVDDSSLLAK